MEQTYLLLVAIVLAGHLGWLGSLFTLGERGSALVLLPRNNAACNVQLAEFVCHATQTIYLAKGQIRAITTHWERGHLSMQIDQEGLRASFE